MLLTRLTLNEPMTNVFEPGYSVLPERLRSITSPSSYPIVNEDLNSITKPLDIDKKEEVDQPIEHTEE
jgi:hypothetical protein